MSEPVLNHVFCNDPSGGHRMVWWEWGEPHAPSVVVCVHGLARQGRDFDVLARNLVAAASEPIRVVCPDVVGRGRSDWLSEPAGYQIPQYVSDLLTMLGALQERAPVRVLDWVGTSMGGLIGMGICGTSDLPLPVPVRRLVLNDVGPVIEWQALARIGAYLGRPDRFADLEHAAQALWEISQSFGPHSPEQWRELCRHMVRLTEQGDWVLHYDPAIAVPFRALTPQQAQAGEAALWMAYDAIQADTFLLRGAVSDLLSRATAVQMGQRGPRARCIEFEGVGHAPTLVAADQVGQVVRFLQR